MTGRLGEADHIHNGHTPGDGYGPDVDPATGDEAETFQPDDDEAEAADVIDEAADADEAAEGDGAGG